MMLENFTIQFSHANMCNADETAELVNIQDGLTPKADITQHTKNLITYTFTLKFDVILTVHRR